MIKDGILILRRRGFLGVLTREEDVTIHPTALHQSDANSWVLQ
jgi:hypothetical protein